MRLLKFFLGILAILFVYKSNFTYGQSKDDILPIQLLYFQGYALSYGVMLRWGTATEINNFGFDIQRADTSKIFNSIGFEPGSGNSNSPKHYFFIDSTLPGQGLYYYRLRQIDYDGTSHLSDTISIFFSQTSVENLNQQNSLNSFSFLIDRANKSFVFFIPQIHKNSYLDFEIYNIRGQLIYQKQNIINQSHLNYSYSNLSSGNYIISISSNGKILFSQKFQVIK